MKSSITEPSDKPPLLYEHRLKHESNIPKWKREWRNLDFCRFQGNHPASNRPKSTQMMPPFPIEYGP